MQLLTCMVTHEWVTKNEVYAETYGVVSLEEKYKQQSIKFLFDLYKQTSSRRNEQESNLNQNQSQPLNQSTHLSQFTDPEHFNEGETGSLEEGPHHIAKKL